MTRSMTAAAALALLAAPAAAQEQTPEALLAVLSDGNCVMPLSEAPAVLGSEGFTEGFVRTALTAMVIDGTAWVDPGGVLRIDDSICPAAGLASAPRTPRAVIAERLRGVDGCSVRQGDLPGLFPNTDRDTLAAVVRAMLADGEAQVDRFTLSVAGEGCPELMPAAAPAEGEGVDEPQAMSAEAEVAATEAVGDADDGDAAAIEADGGAPERTEAAQTAVEAVEGAPVISDNETEGAPEGAMEEGAAAAEETAGAAGEDAAAGTAAEEDARPEDAASAEEAEAGAGEDNAEVAVEAAEDAPVVAGAATEGATEAVDEAVEESAEAAGAEAGTTAEGATEGGIAGLRETLVAEAASRDCAIRQSQIADALPEADADELLEVVMGLVADGSARIDRFTLRLSEEACAGAAE